MERVTPNSGYRWCVFRSELIHTAFFWITNKLRYLAWQKFTDVGDTSAILSDCVFDKSRSREQAPNCLLISCFCWWFHTTCQQTKIGAKTNCSMNLPLVGQAHFKKAVFNIFSQKQNIFVCFACLFKQHFWDWKCINLKPGGNFWKRHHCRVCANAWKWWRHGHTQFVFRELSSTWKCCSSVC